MMGKYSIFDQAKKEGRSLLTEFESKRILKQIGIPVVETRLATNLKEVVSISQRLGFPVVLKIASPDVVHKTDSGGVKLDLKTISDVKKAYHDILSSVKKRSRHARIHGISIQKMAPPGTEVIIGTSKDPQFGPVIMFGLGGIFVEVLKDVSFRIIPVVRKDAREMIQEIKGYALLRGYRGKEPANISSLTGMILKISKFVNENPYIREMELNPIFAYKDKALAVDARIILEGS